MQATYSPSKWLNTILYTDLERGFNHVKVLAKFRLFKSTAAKDFLGAKNDSTHNSRMLILLSQYYIECPFRGVHGAAWEVETQKIEVVLDSNSNLSIQLQTAVTFFSHWYSSCFQISAQKITEDRNWACPFQIHQIAKYPLFTSCINYRRSKLALPISNTSDC